MNLGLVSAYIGVFLVKWVLVRPAGEAIGGSGELENLHIFRRTHEARSHTLAIGTIVYVLVVIVVNCVKNDTRWALRQGCLKYITCAYFLDTICMHCTMPSLLYRLLGYWSVTSLIVLP